MSPHCGNDSLTTLHESGKSHCTYGATGTPCNSRYDAIFSNASALNFAPYHLGIV